MDGLEKGVVDEDVLLFGLHQKVALVADVAQEAADVELVLALDLLQHGVQHDVRS